MASQLNELTDEQLTHKMFDIERQLVATRFQHSLGNLENTAELRVLRKEIARIQTAARAREIEQGLPKGSLIRTHRASYGGAGEAPVETAQKGGGFLKGIVDKLTGNE